jgi:hypothetical protein
MSTLKTTDNATLPGRKTVATAQSRGARQAKKRIMPRKLNPEPKVDEPKKPYQRTPEEDDAKDRVVARNDGRPFLPKVKFGQGSGGPKLDLDHDDSVTARLLLMDALGISDHHFLHGYLDQIIHTATRKADDDTNGINEMLGAIAGMKPRDEMEAMLCAQMVATHNLAMTFAGRLKYVENIPQQDSAANALTKLTRTYAAQMAVLKHYRTGGEQRVIVQRVDVREGGQAVVGVVNSSRGGECSERNGGKSHAKQIADAPGTAVLCDIEAEREALPSSGGTGPADLPDAWGD